MTALRRLARAACLPALAGVLVPKCPLCVAAYLTAIGAGAGLAAAVAPVVIHAAHIAGGLAAVAIGVHLLRARLARQRRGAALVSIRVGHARTSC